MVIEIEAVEVPEVPEVVDGPEGVTFREYMEVRNAVEAHVLGTELLSPCVREARSQFADNPNRVRRLFLARRDGVPVGRAMTTVRVHDLDAGAHVVADVLPHARGAGIGQALFDAAIAAAHDAGCSMLLVNTPHTTDTGGERIVSPTGFGDVPAEDPGARFLVSHGFALEQVNRVSMLSTDGLEAALAPVREAAAAVAGADFALRTWRGPAPRPWLHDLAVLRTRMSIDAPSGGVDARIDPWDPERVAAHDQRTEDGGQEAVTVVAEHVATGHLVAFTELYVSGHDVVAVQEDTLVLAEHRGRRLGALLKAAAGQELVSHHPRVEQIVTYNAEENRPMLDVNEQLGFRAVGYEGTWQKGPRLQREYSA